MKKFGFNAGKIVIQEGKHCQCVTKKIERLTPKSVQDRLMTMLNSKKMGTNNEDLSFLDSQTDE